MNKNYFFPLLASALLVSCGPVIEGSSSYIPALSDEASSSTASSSSSLTSSSDDGEAERLDALLEPYRNQNITYKSAIDFYYYEKGKPETKDYLQRLDAVAKYTPEAFSFEARFKGEEDVYSSLLLAEDAKGMTAYQSINLNGKAVTTEALDASENPIAWDDSIYHNLLSHVAGKDLVKQEDGSYHIEGANNKYLLADIGSAASNTTNLYPNEIDYGAITFDDKGTMSLLIQEKESDEVYEGYIYGRSINISFEDIGTTVVKTLEDLKEVEENAPLKEALAKLRAAKNYTIITNATLLSTGKSKFFSEARFTENDYLLMSATDDGYGILYSGVHKDGEKTYSYVSNDTSRFVGVETEDIVSAHLPTFDFTHNLFTLQGTENGVSTFTIAEYPEVLNFVSTDPNLASSFANALNKPILFKVKDNALTSIEIPAYIPDENGSGQEATLTLTYKDYEATDPAALLKGFKTEAETASYASYDDVAANGNKEGFATISDVFKRFFGDEASSFPFVLPAGIKFYEDVSYQAGMEPLYPGDPGTPASLSTMAKEGHYASAEEIRSLTTAFEGAGFTRSGSSFADEVTFTKTVGEYNVKVGVINSDIVSNAIPFAILISFEK